tara:strand:- start:416 stop:628 length:213 start_codon:yes stop_codon:yes gene_type:complete
MCENTVIYYIPKGHVYQEVPGTCGRTGYNGDRLLCNECRNDPAIMQALEIDDENAAADNAWLKSAGWGEM